MTPVPNPVLSALGRLNAHARARSSYGLRKAIYAYKTAAACVLVKGGAVSTRLVAWTGACNRCTNGRFQHWSWDDGYTVACRDCGGTGRRTLRFTETTLPDGQIWHHPWYVGDGKGADIARRAFPGMQDGDGWQYLDADGNPIPWHEAGSWSPNLPGAELELADLVHLLNTVEDWVEGIEHDNWLIHSARSFLFQRTHRDVFGEVPAHEYQIDLGRAPGGCFVCGSDGLAGYGYGRVTPLFHWSLPVCQRHGEGPEKVPHPKDPPPESLLTAEVRRWLLRHERVVAAP